MKAAYHMGDYLQLMDDITDIEIDKKLGIRSSVNNGLPVTEAIRSAYAAALQHHERCFDQASTEESGVLRWLEVMGGLWWRRSNIPKECRVLEIPGR
jgi:hypothetical protein